MGAAVVVGGSGFVGSEVVRRLRERGFQVSSLVAPRLTWAKPRVKDTAAEVARTLIETGLRQQLYGADVVVNAAGIAGPASSSAALFGANALLPAALAQACEEAAVPRFVHVSSAAVQGRRVLDETSTFSPSSEYARSKCLAELLIGAREPTKTQVVIYRPTSVQGPGRAVTLRLKELANSSYSTCSTPGSDPTPQIHIGNVGVACAFLATSMTNPPAVVLHPWEGWTTRTFLFSLSRSEPRQIPRGVALALVRTALAASSLAPRYSFQARRVEMLLLGQRQRPGWFEAQGVPWRKRFADWDGQSDPWTEGS